jgi:glycosyltransferase involved in cell wall biosynthesis
VDIDEWENDNEPMPDELARMIAMHREQGRFLVGYAGAHGIANALDSLVKAGQMLQDEVTFFLVGQGPEKNKLQQQADQLDARNVLFMPTIARQAIPAFLRSMDALYIGLQREPLFRFGVSPNKLMDYMMAARPIVYAIEAGNDPVRANQCGVSVIPEDPDALCCGIQWLRQQSNDERDQMGQRGSRYVRQNHNYQSLAQQFIQEVENMS